MDNSIQKTTLYRYFDSEGQLLYVGITKNPLERQAQHQKTQPWWDDVTSARFEHYSTREEAIKAEDYAIGTEWPRYNIAGPSLAADQKQHLLDLLFGNHDDEEHQKQYQKMTETMLELAKFSNKPAAHRLLFAFGESFEWDSEGENRYVFCHRCESILESRWFRNLYENVHGEICDEA
jgi:predicted GIY-YIG superfamily endonuclease